MHGLGCQVAAGQRRDSRQRRVHLAGKEAGGSDDARRLAQEFAARQQRLEGEVQSIGYAINPPNLADTEGPKDLIPTIQPTFEWIRLAQRVPVRIRLVAVPDNLHLVSGMTASIAIEK